MALEPITRQEQIIAGKDLEPITRMEKFLKEYGGGGASSWNDLTDKPFGEEKAFEPIVWDGNTEGLEKFEFSDSYAHYVYYKVGDYAEVDKSQIESITVLMKIPSGDEEQTLNFAEEGDDAIDEGANPGHGYNLGGGVVFLSDGQFTTNGIPIVFPEGVWFTNVDMGGATMIATKLIPVTTIKPLDEKYLPPLVSPSGKKFKLSVDDSGVLSATEV